MAERGNMTENYWDKLLESDEHAASYMETYGEGAGSDTRHLLFSFVNDGESVLDVGCGPGWNLDHTQKFGPKLFGYRGLDYSERFVRVANLRHPDNHRFRVGDCRKLNEGDLTWDVVILQDVLEHTNGFEEPIKEALRVAKKRVIITFWRGFGEDQMNDDGDDGWGATYNKERFEKFLDDLGYFWCDTETPPDANRWHAIYVVDKKPN